MDLQEDIEEIIQRSHKECYDCGCEDAKLNEMGLCSKCQADLLLLEELWENREYLARKERNQLKAFLKTIIEEKLNYEIDEEQPEGHLDQSEYDKVHRQNIKLQPKTKTSKILDQAIKVHNDA